MVVNPRLECVPLVRTGAGWRVAPDPRFVGAGPVCPGRDLRISVPVGSAIARVMDSGSRWPAPAESSIPAFPATRKPRQPDRSSMQDDLIIKVTLGSRNKCEMDSAADAADRIRL